MKNPQKTCAIRMAVAADGDWIARMQVAMAEESEGMILDLNRVGAGVQRFFDEPARGFYLIAETPPRGAHPTQRIGCLLCQTEWSDWRNGEVWWLHSLYVVPGLRRQGVFLALYDFLKDKALRNGILGIRLYVERNNLSAQQAYRRIGMTDEHYILFEQMFDE